MKALLALAIGVTIVAPKAFAAWDTPVTGAACANEVDGRLKKLGSKDEWMREVDAAVNTLTYRSPTTKMGSWIELRRSGDGTNAGAIELRTIAAAGVDQYKWDAGCKETTTKLATGKAMARSEGGKKFFLDSDLASLMKKNKEGLIYVWSPSLVYSMKYYSRYKEMADKLGLPLTVLMDPHWRQNVAKDMAKEFNMPFFDTRAESVELFMRDVGIHYPATIVYSQGKLTRHVIFGIEEPQKLASVVTEELQRMKK